MWLTNWSKPRLMPSTRLPKNVPGCRMILLTTPSAAPDHVAQPVCQPLNRLDGALDHCLGVANEAAVLVDALLGVLVEGVAVVLELLSQRADQVALLLVEILFERHELIGKVLLRSAGYCVQVAGLLIHVSPDCLATLRDARLGAIQLICHELGDV